MENTNTQNTKLSDARRNKDDEYFTPLGVIEQELKHYKSHFRDKVIYLPCDNIEHSQFWKYFSKNFDKFEIKKLIASHWTDGAKSSIVTVIEGDDVLEYQIEGDGDFRSPSCRYFFDEADVIITNPPFSLFGEFIELLADLEKDCIVLGNCLAINNQKVTPHIITGDLQIGYSPRSMEFIIPDENGNEIDRKAINSWWYTTFPVSLEKDFLENGKMYYEYIDLYTKYDNLDAINVDKISEIPDDYFGLMGVPITFLSEINRDQFDIIGFGKSPDLKELPIHKVYHNPVNENGGRETVVNRCLTINIDKLESEILKLRYQNKKTYTADNSEGRLIVPFTRMLIKRIFNGEYTDGEKIG